MGKIEEMFTETLRTAVYVYIYTYIYVYETELCHDNTA